jgi:superfamily II DNA or RNA helicase
MTNAPEVGARLSLWPHQRNALSTVSSFLRARRSRGGPAALIRMPTGTGKSGVIAVAAHELVRERDVLVLTPWDVLVDQLTDDIRGRFWNRIGAEVPTGKKALRVYPSTVTRALQDEGPPAIWTATIATLQQLHKTADPAYSELSKRIALVVVDEGHYEPAPTWAQAVRGLETPTVLFTATPYRNDFKFFDVDDEFCFFYSHEAAETDRFVRTVRFESHEFETVPGFCDGLVNAWERLFPKEPRPRVIVRCRTKNGVQAVAAELVRRGLTVVAVHERFEGADGTYLRRRVPNPDIENAQFWVHQNKLIEGVDDPRFRLVAFFEPFSSERAFVQQVGRVLRNPGQKARQHAWIFHDPRHRLQESWDAYRAYDSVAGPDALVSSPRDFAKVQPAIQYVTGRFREQFDIASPTVHEDFDYPRSTRVYLVPEGLSLDELAEAITREWDEYDFDVEPVLTPEPSTRLHPYIAIRNSPLLLRRAFAEYEVGFTIYRRIRNYLLFYDSQGKTPEALASLERVETNALHRMYAGENASLSSVTLLNTNLSRHSVRRRLLQAYSIGELGPDLSDHAHLASTATGRADAPDWAAERTLTRYVGFTKSRVSDRVGGTTPFDEYMRWLEYLADLLDDQTIEPLAVFERYAEVIGVPRDPTPINILLDFEQDAFETVSEGARVNLSIDDLCLPVSDGTFECTSNGVPYQVSVSWDSGRRNYRLESPSLDHAFSMKSGPGDRRAESLVGFLNREQAFRIVPASAGADYCVYAGGRFCRPRLPLWGGTRSPQLELLQIMHGVSELATIATEKGTPGSATSTGWAAASLFALIDSLGVGTSMHSHLQDVGLLVCDDMGTEIADFIALDEAGGRVLAIHAKAFKAAKPLSAGALHEISSQALKNLGYFQPYFVGEPKNLNRWNGQWRGSQGQVASRIRRGGPVTGRGAWKKIRTALLNPQTTREVWLVLGQGPSIAAFDAERRKSNPRAEVVQMLYSLQSTWAAVSSVGARLQLFCSP